jgi:hypothetical protein
MDDECYNADDYNPMKEVNPVLIKPRTQPQPQTQFEITQPELEPSISRQSRRVAEISADCYNEKMGPRLAEIRKRITNINDVSKEYLLNILLSLMDDLVKNGGNDLLIIKHDSARMKYEEYVDIVNEINDTIITIENRRKIRKNALDKLSDEEKEILNIKVTE